MEQYIQDAIAYAKENIDEEVCGLVVVHNGKQRFVRCRNIADRPKDGFVIHAEDWVKADAMGEIVCVVHSHPTTKPTPSEADLVGCEKTGIPWTIVNPRTEEFHTFEPTGYKAPLFNRVFSFGVLDCYAFVRDYYAEEYGLQLSDYDRTDGFWRRGEDLYRDHFAKEGFYEIPADQIKAGDAIIMNVESDIGNHAAVYLGNNMIAHHLYSRLSSRDIYGGYYRKHTMYVLRHKDLNK